ncbi:MAG TPA: ABC transporter transmembrane domain-containing protein [Rhizomicrobium sp.]|nr:ABC transporter transmembrane domain-containing protein [Rhizomicrobium sp.]
MSGRPKSRSVTPLTSVLPFLKPYRGRIAAGFLALLCSSTATLILPFFARGLIDHGFSAQEAGEVGRYFLAFIAAASVLGLSSATRFYFVTWLGERVTADIRKAVFDNVLGLTPAFFEITRTGEVLSRLTADTTLVQTVIGSSASVALRNAVNLSVGIVLMLFTSLKLTLLVLGAVLVVMLPLILFGRWVRTLSRTSQDRIADSSARASETLNAVQTVQAFTRERDERRSFAGTVERSFDAAITRTRARAVMTAMVIFSFFSALAGVLYVGAQDVIAHRITGGLLVQFIFLGVLVAGGFGSLSEVWGDLQRAAGASERLMELLHTKPAIAPPLHPRSLPKPARGAIAFEHVVFHYPSRPDSAALRDFSLAVAPGEAVALVGPSGAGKSTVFQLLLRFFAAQEGRLLFDGVDIAELDPVQLRGAVAVVAQDPVIFSGSIASNIAYGRDGATPEDVRRAADAAAAAEFIERLPQGFDTIVGERGVTLSGGQRQRLAIARAILRDAPLLLLDEATSALDAENELLVQRGLANLMVGRTTIVIAHRLATIQKLQRIVVMDQGRVVGEGSHGELVRQGGLYARLAELQFAPNNPSDNPPGAKVPA